MPVCFGRTDSLGERLTVCIRAGEATKVCAVALATLVTKNDIVSCCACAGVVRFSPISAAAAKKGILIVVTKTLPLFGGGLYVPHGSETSFARRAWMLTGGSRNCQFGQSPRLKLLSGDYFNSRYRVRLTVTFFLCV